MSTYIPLGPRRAVGVLDTTGNNPNKWTVTFDNAALNVKIPFFEIYKVIITGAANSTMTWFMDNWQWETTAAGDINSWDPNQALEMQPGKTLYFYWSDLVTDNTPPTVTVWMRYDTDIPANQSAAGGVAPIAIPK